jgi:hypothetical protein
MTGPIILAGVLRRPPAATNMRGSARWSGLDLVSHPELPLGPTHLLACGVANFVPLRILAVFQRR